MLDKQLVVIMSLHDMYSSTCDCSSNLQYTIVICAELCSQHLHVIQFVTGLCF